MPDWVSSAVAVCGVLISLTSAVIALFVRSTVRESTRDIETKIAILDRECNRLDRGISDLKKESDKHFESYASLFTLINNVKSELMSELHRIREDLARHLGRMDP